MFPRFLSMFFGIACSVIICSTAWAQTPPADSFNRYILRAVKHLQSTYPSKGYDINRAYSHKIAYNGDSINPTNPPRTMCVAAVAEAIIYAIKFYVEETGDKSVYEFLPASTWNSMRPRDLRSHIWVDGRLDAYGTADALVTFGIGKRVRFSELTPGSFLNINRNRPGKKPTGHAVIFLAYLDAKGNELTTYSDAAVGFKYWSAQGNGTTGDSGYAYRYAFLNKLPNQTGYCPQLPGGKKVDCWILNSKSSKYLNMGYMLHPSKWNRAVRDENLELIKRGLYEQTRSRSPLGIPELDPEISYADFDAYLEENDTMKLNEIFPDDASTE
ncbi:hypothetical protein ABGN05_20305 [Aquibium sp. LZ166]|uniref:Peptidase C39-like domain-containing protein n=1 Tax=Aquibium pacificus TaxID=3153579 RepID=A0ABV3SR40_9HYPH